MGLSPSIVDAMGFGKLVFPKLKEMKAEALACALIGRLCIACVASGLPTRYAVYIICLCARTLLMYPSLGVSSAKMLYWRYLTFGRRGAGSSVPSSFILRHFLRWFCRVLLMNEVSNGIDLRTLRWPSVASPHDVHDGKWLYHVGRTGFFCRVK